MSDTTLKPSKDIEGLVNYLLPIAQKSLAQYGEFYPYAGCLTPDGEILQLGAQLKDVERPKSQPLIDLLYKHIRSEVEAQHCKASAIIFDVSITPSGATEKSDAIQVCLDHRDGYSAEVFFPYQLKDGQLIQGKPFSQEGAYPFFPKATPSAPAEESE